MKIILPILSIISAALVSSAQTNEPVVQVKFYSDPNATNKITFLEKGPIQTIWAVVEETFPNSGHILMTRMIPIVDEYGNQLRREPGNEIVLANYPALEILTTGREISLDAQQVGTIRGIKRDGADSSKVLELWEYCTPPQPTPEQIAAVREAARIKSERQRQKYLQGQTNAVRFLQSEATNESASAQCDLGIHYLTGLGCETNREQAIYWLQKSAAQGNLEASNKLATLKP